MNVKPLYFDSAATTAVYPALNETIARYNSECFFNASALYAQASESVKAIEGARAKIATILGVDTTTITFTSCATESNNWVLRSICARPLQSEIVITEGEHAAVKETAAALACRGVKVITVPLLPNGQVDRVRLLSALSSKTNLVSMIHVSNETGAINDIAAIAAEIKENFPEIRVHSDGVQAFGKVKTSLKNIDFYSVSAHKIHAPKGIGALYASKRCRLTPYMTGGGQERGLRSGTENVSGIVAFGLAAQQFAADYSTTILGEYRTEIIEKLTQTEGFFLNLDSQDACSPHVITCGFSRIRGETLLHALSEKGIIIGRGSSCSSHISGNTVLASIGAKNDNILSSIRISLDMSLTKKDIEMFCETVKLTVNELRGKLL